MAKAGHLSQPRRWALAGVLGATALVTVIGPGIGPGRGQTAGPARSAPTKVKSVSPAERARLLDRAVGLVDRARQAYQGIRDYSCVFVKRERIDGELQPENVMSMTVRTQPFSVGFTWAAPKPLAGQEVCYVAGKNDGMMRVHPAGLLGSVGFVSIPTDDARALQNSRHPITQAGLGNLIDRLANQYALSRQSADTTVSIGEYEYNRRRCVRVEIRHPDSAGGTFQAYRSVVYFDKELALPTRVETYDWPKPGADKGDLLAVYSYLDLRTNVNPGDEVFDK